MIRGEKELFRRDINTRTGFLFLLIFSTIVAWLTIRTGEKIINNAPESNIYASQRDAQKMIDLNIK